MSSISSTPPAPPTRSRVTGDQRLIPYFLRASRAYGEALQRGDLITADELTRILAALSTCEQESEVGNFATLADPLAALNERFRVLGGDAAAKAGLGRGRAEQFSTALRLWLMDELDGLTQAIATLQQALLEQAERHVATLMPGIVALRPTQVIAVGQWLLSYFWMLARDQERLTAVIGRAAISPLGSGVLAGVTGRIERKQLASTLRFAGVTENSVDAVFDLDFAVEFTFSTTLLSAHLNRLAGDLLSFTSPMNGFISFDAGFDAGSAVERAQARMGASLASLTALISGVGAVALPLNAEAPEARAALFVCADSVAATITALQKAVTAMMVRPDRLYAALDGRILSADLVEYLVGRGEQPEIAQTVVERCYARADELGKPLAEVDLKVLQRESRFFDADVFALFDYARSAAQRTAQGGTASSALRNQIRQAANWLVEAGFE